MTDPPSPLVLTAGARRIRALLLLAMGACLCLPACWLFPRGAALSDGTALSLDWNEALLLSDRYTEGFQGPVAARAFAYIGLAAYEAARPAEPETFRSLAADFQGLRLPAYEAGHEFYLPAALNACYHTMLDLYFSTSPASVVQQRQLLFEDWEERLAAGASPERLADAAAYGRAVARAVYEWSAKDRVGHEAFLRAYDKDYPLSEAAGAWQPSVYFPSPPLLPHWKEVRTFVADTADYIARPLPKHSSDPNSLYYSQALEVYTLSRPASAESRWIAEFWSDDHNGLTYSPAGRWISMSNQIIAAERPDVWKALETYLKVGIALHDSFVACWASKYRYSLERPETFIHRVFDADWAPSGPAPPFPAYPSGHSMTSAAAAEVLATLYGRDYAMTDRSHEDRREFNGMPRHFSSFQEMANESALSRLYLGVHYRMDCEEGLRLGFLLGKEVANSLQLRHKKYLGEGH